MSYYAIGIGGTGAKCLESLIHLAAAGMMPDGDLYVLFVDPDNTNGSRTDVENTIEKYKECKDNLTLGQTDLLKTKINIIDCNGEKHWNPFNTRRDTAPLLEQFFRATNLSKEAAHLFKVLYSHTERTYPLSKGFHGHPSIGSAIMAETVDFQNTEPWKGFLEQILTDNAAKVFFAGSIFGGTGASGFPTIAKRVRAELEKKDQEALLGGALVLPYFKFITAQNDQANELRADSRHFLMNTQAALTYYYDRDQIDIYDAVYLLGNVSETTVENVSGGLEQKNAPHFIELYAALAAIHFFEKGRDGYFLTARNDRSVLGWRDLPDDNNGNTIRSSIGQLTRFAFAYLHTYQPILKELRKSGGRDSRNVVWFRNFFRYRTRLGLRNPNGIQLDDDSENLLNNIAEYCQYFLCWLANIQSNCDSENERIELIQDGAFAENGKKGEKVVKPVRNFDDSRFSDLIPGHEYINLSALWDLMCASNGKVSDAEGIGKFLSTLYENCGK